MSPRARAAAGSAPLEHATTVWRGSRALEEAQGRRGAQSRDRGPPGGRDAGPSGQPHREPGVVGDRGAHPHDDRAAASRNRCTRRRLSSQEIHRESPGPGRDPTVEGRGQLQVDEARRSRMERANASFRRRACTSPTPTTTAMPASRSARQAAARPRRGWGPPWPRPPAAPGVDQARPHREGFDRGGRRARASRRGRRRGLRPRLLRGRRSRRGAGPPPGGTPARPPGPPGPRRNRRRDWGSSGPTPGGPESRARPM